MEANLTTLSLFDHLDLPAPAFGPEPFVARLSNTPLVFLDVETTGASPAWGDRVTEVGLVRVEDGQVTERYQQLCNPGRHIPAGIAALTGITNEMVADAPPFEACHGPVLRLMKDAVAIGHNVRFDLGFMASEFDRDGVDLAASLGFPQVMDTVRIARRVLGPRGNGLQKLAARFHINVAAAHRALADADTTRQVLACLLPVSTPIEHVFATQGGSVSWPRAKVHNDDLPLDLADALAARRPVMMRYIDASDAITERLVQPLTLRRKGREVMLVAHCHLRNQRRTFRLDRVVSFSC